MAIITAILYLVGFVCFVMAAFARPEPPWRVNLTAAGLAAWILPALIAALGALGH